MGSSQVPRVAVLVFPGAVAFDVMTVLETLAAQTAEGLPRYDVTICSTRGLPVRTAAGFTMSPDGGLHEAEQASILVVPGSQNPEADPPDEVIKAVKEAYARGARLVAFGAGAFVLARAGLLDGRHATTHWRYAGLLAADHPGVLLDPDVLYVEDGQILTCAGLVAGVDLCLDIIRTDHGASAADEVARSAVTAYQRPANHSQVVQRLVTRSGDGGLSHLRAWMLAHLADPMPVSALARQVFLSKRQFTRVFRMETGTSPWQWLLEQRLLRARHLLERTDDPIDAIVHCCGFTTSAAFRAQFKRAVGTTPSTYRRLYRGAAPRVGTADA